MATRHTHKANFVEIVVRVICGSYIRHSSKPHKKKIKVLNQNVSLWNLSALQNISKTNKQTEHFLPQWRPCWLVHHTNVNYTVHCSWMTRKTSHVPFRWENGWTTTMGFKMNWMNRLENQMPMLLFTSFYEGKHALCSVLSHILKHIWFSRWSYETFSLLFSAKQIISQAYLV